jgi:ricin-type beta-trefoil lectin protein
MKYQRFEIVRNLTLAAASIVAGLAAFHSLAAQQTSSARIFNARSLKCLQPVSGSNAEGAAIVLATCDTTNAAQYWVKVPVSGNVAHYMNISSQMCLDARGGPANGTPVQQWPCNKITNENWQYAQDASDTEPKLISRVSGTSTYCLAIPGVGTDDGIAVQILTCNGSPEQHWYAP